MVSPIQTGRDHLQGTPEEVLRVANTTVPQKLAEAINQAFYETQVVTLRAVGAGAVNQAIKGLAIARSYLRHRNLDLVVRPEFESIKSIKPGEEQISAVVLIASLA